MRIEDLAAAIAALAPEEQLRLYRLLRLMGHRLNRDPVTDRRRLVVAPALGSGRNFEIERIGDEISAPATLSPPAAPTFVQPIAPADRPPAAPTPRYQNSDRQDSTRQDNDQAEYKSPVKAKIVHGAPAQPDAPSAHLMPPLPGQAPESPISIVFSGGSQGDPGRGHGNYSVQWPGDPRQLVRLQFGPAVTGDQAQYDSLIAALEATLARLEEHQAQTKTARLVIHSDSPLVVNQVRGLWRCNEPLLQIRLTRTLALLEMFGAWKLEVCLTSPL